MKPTRPKRTRLRASAKHLSRQPKLDPEARKALEANVGYAFTVPAILDRAVTHGSALANLEGKRSYERLEFLGDRVLGLVIAEHLIAVFPNESEGGLASRLNALVNRDACAQVARQIDLGTHVLMDASEARSGGRDKASILADACEALIGAIYQDGGLKAARTFILAKWREPLGQLAVRPRDPKSTLQEWAQANGHAIPTYEIVGRVGPDHEPVFAARVLVGGLPPVEGRGQTKQDAQRNAASAMLADERYLTMKDSPE